MGWGREQEISRLLCYQDEAGAQELIRRDGRASEENDNDNDNHRCNGMVSPGGEEKGRRSIRAESEALAVICIKFSYKSYCPELELQRKGRVSLRF